MIRCRYCADSGCAFASRKDEPNAGPYIFLCSCSEGQRRNSSYPQWANANQSPYDLQPAYTMDDMASMRAKPLVRTQAGILADIEKAKEDEL